MKEENKKFIEDMQLRSPRQWLSFLNENRKIYNCVCKQCKSAILQRGGNIELQNFCPDCQEKVKPYLEKVARLFESAGAIVKK